MQMLRCVRQRQRSPFSTTNPFFFSTTPAASSSAAPLPFQTSAPYPFFPSAAAYNFTSADDTTPLTMKTNSATSDIVSSFKDWFLSRKNPFMEQIFGILRSQDDNAAGAALCRLRLRLTEDLVLQVLNYQRANPDVLACLKFFDWAGRQPGFHHTQATYSAIFRILSKAKLMSLMLEFLDAYLKQKYIHKVRFYSTLVIGYSVAGKPELALQLFGRMRFQGQDLDGFGYNVLLNALVEEGLVDEVEMVVKQIQLRGFENLITHSILIKSFVKRKELDKAEEYVRSLTGEGLSGVAIAELVDALCKDKQFKRAAFLVEDFKKIGKFTMEPVYGVWIRNLIKVGKLEGALEFLKVKRLVDGYIPDVFRYNSLVNRLLRENRLEDVFELLTEMKEQNVMPDEVTMNTTMCFFCKAGMADVAVELYDSRAEFGLSVSSMTYNYLINTLVGDVCVDEAYRVLETAVRQGYTPGKKTMSIIAGALCREGKIDKVKDLVLVAFDNNCKLMSSTYNKLISALCRARRVEDGYIVHGHLSRLSKVTSRKTYINMIKGFYLAKRGDIAARLLIEMLDKGHTADRLLFRGVIRCLSLMDNSHTNFFSLLQMLLSRKGLSSNLFNYFIDGAGFARQPELARKVYEIMGKSGIQPNLRSDILMLQSYIKSAKIADAFIFFSNLPEKRRSSKRMWNAIVVGLCKVERSDYALEFLREMRKNGLKPSMECYEELVKLLCAQKKYSVVLNLVEDLAQIRPRISSFIGNVLLLHCLYTRKLFDVFCERSVENPTKVSQKLGQLIGAFSCLDVSQDIEDLEKMIKECFNPDLHTYNVLLRRLIMTQIDHAPEYVDKIREKGYEPNEWTYDSLVHGYCKVGRVSEARKWMDLMLQKGFDLSEATKMIT